MNEDDVTSSLCADHDHECPSIFAEGYAMKCWLHDPGKGFCPYLRSTEQPAEQEEKASA